MRKRFINEQGGFSLPEMLTTMVIMIVVLFSLYSIFDMAIRVFSFGNDKIEAVENARLGLQKMEREIRAAYPVNGSFSTGTNRYRFFNANGATSSPPQAWPSATQITFGNELSPRDDSIRCPSPTSCEYITYKLVGSSLQRVNFANSSAAGESVVEFVRPNGLQFKYFTSDGTEINPASPGINPVTGEPRTTQDIGRVEITLQIEVDEVTQDLTTMVDLRNPGEIS